MGSLLLAFPVRALAAVFALAAVAAGCDSKPRQDGAGLATVRVRIGSKDFTLEVADTDALRQKGLMRRDSMPKDHGMIFVFPDEAERSFWMKNTRIPLDIIYLNSAGRIVSIKQMKPYDMGGTPSDGPAQYAIELNQGTAQKVGIKSGATLELPKGLKARD